MLNAEEAKKLLDVMSIPLAWLLSRLISLLIKPLKK